MDGRKINTAQENQGKEKKNNRRKKTRTRKQKNYANKEKKSRSLTEETDIGEIIGNTRK